MLRKMVSQNVVDIGIVIVCDVRNTIIKMFAEFLPAVFLAFDVVVEAFVSTKFAHDFKTKKDIEDRVQSPVVDDGFIVGFLFGDILKASEFLNLFFGGKCGNDEAFKQLEVVFELANADDTFSEVIGML